MQILTREIFNGGVTGEVDVAAMRQYLDAANAKIHDSAMYKWNAKELLDAHEWDDTFLTRLERLKKLKRWEPLISVRATDGGVFVIDGWHRLYLLNSEVPELPNAIVRFPTYIVGMEECEMFRPSGIIDAGKINREPLREVVKEEQDQAKEESFGGTFGSVATPSGGALVHNRIQAAAGGLEAAEKTDKRN